jgi:hypothetical protein
MRRGRNACRIRAPVAHVGRRVEDKVLRIA